VVLPVGAAFGEARVADDTDDLVALDQLPRRGGPLGRVELLGVQGVPGRPPADAAVVVDAVVVGLGDLADRREVDAGDQHGDAAHLDRRTRRLLAGTRTAFADRRACGGRADLRGRA